MTLASSVAYKRFDEESKRCYQGKWRVAHPDYTRARIERAVQRRNLCVKNGGAPDPDEPPELSDDDEETGRNLHR